jgi:hypothetical protein
LGKIEIGPSHIDGKPFSGLVDDDETGRGFLRN